MCGDRPPLTGRSKLDSDPRRHGWSFCTTTFIWAAWLGLMASPSSAAVFRASSPDVPGLPVIAVIGCKLVGGTLVCGRDGTLLPNRLRRPKATIKEPKKTYQPPKKKTQSKTGSSSKKSGTTGKPAPAENSSATKTEEGGADKSVGHICPPGHVVLEEANAAGSFCEPVNTQVPDAAPAPVTVAPAPAVSNGTPQPSAKQTSQTPTPKPQICCSAQAVDSSGRPHPGDGTISLCGPTEQEAKPLLAPFAEASNYLLTGPIDCKPK